MAPPARHNEHRLFVRDGWRHFRRRYAVNEARWSLVVIAVLVAVAWWVHYRGAHPWQASSAEELGSPAQAVLGSRNAAADSRSDAGVIQARSQSLTAGSKGRGAGSARGPLPTNLAAPGWREAAVSQYGPDNLYVKIDGRADYFLSFGFRRLYVVRLEQVNQNEAGATVDVELYDLGTAANALGAYAGERSPTSVVRVSDSGLGQRNRNALLATHGKYYLRAIGSDESSLVVAQLERLEQELAGGLPGERLPWAYALFVGKLGLDAGRVSYLAQQAFSFGFARDVYTARYGKGDTQIFVVTAREPRAARALARRFDKGFASYGEVAARDGAVHWIADRYLGTLAGVTTYQRWVIGVRGAGDVSVGRQALADLRRALAELPETVRARAQPASLSHEGGADERGASRGRAPAD